jgi:hypothetical protein
VIAEAPASRLTLVVPSLRQRAKSLGKLRVLQLWQSLFEPKPGEDDRTMSEQQGSRARASHDRRSEEAG